MRGGRPGIRTDICTYDDKCQDIPSQRFSVDICDRHALKVHAIVEMGLARARLTEILAGEAERPDQPDDMTSELRQRLTTWIARTGPTAIGGYVYFVRFDGMIKIGFSRRPENRLRDIPHQEVLKVIKGTMADESWYHNRCTEWRVVGEWFRDCPEFRAAAQL